MGKKRRIEKLGLLFFVSTSLVSISLFLLASATILKNDNSGNRTPIPTTDNIPANRDAVSLQPQRKCKDALSRNSALWLRDERLGNSEDMLSYDQAAKSILTLPSSLGNPLESNNHYLAQAISHPSSEFRQTLSFLSDKKSIRLWQVRLAFLAIFYHQHRHAFEEAKVRLAHDCTEQLIHHKIGPYDYECPAAKYLVVGLGKLGLGANMRAAAVKALLTGLATDRIVLFINNIRQPLRKKTTGDMGPWALASCARRDHQCFFRPLSPCVLRLADLDGAHILSKNEMRAMIKSGKQPVGRENDRVLMMHLKFAPQLDVPQPVVTRLQDYSRIFLSHLDEEDKRRLPLELAVARLAEPDARREIGYNYAQANTRIHHSLTFYAMRPNNASTTSMNKLLASLRTAPHRKNLIGLPIRASDKCNQESECLTFTQHLAALNNTQDLIPQLEKSSLIFTTESRDMVRQKDMFMSSSEPNSSPYDFITNPHDVLPDTGFVLQRDQTDSNYTEDDMIHSAMISLQLQLSASYTLANCCSNFHTLIGDYLIEGLGAVRNNTFRCLQEHQDPEYAICCGWHKDCKRERKEYLQNKSREATM